MKKEDIEAVLLEAKNEINSLDLEAWRIKYIGRKGLISDFFSKFKSLEVEDKKVLGPVLNKVKAELNDLYLEEKNKGDKNLKEFFDYTIKGKKIELGTLNPTTLVQRELCDVFKELGFQIIEGPEIENEYYNFDALNIPKNHPARDLWDTFWFPENLRLIGEKDKGDCLLRTHTSPVQVRFMENEKPPFSVVVPGRTFRYEATDARHEFQFHQLEGLMVSEDINLANFKMIIKEAMQRIFKGTRKIRFLPSYFPFVSPGLQVDIECFKCHGKDNKCPLCSGSGWIEVLGAGMVHPKLFEMAGYPKGKYQGFAFGIGIERFAMVKYLIDDTRFFNSTDLRFLKQFK